MVSSKLQVGGDLGLFMFRVTSMPSCTDRILPLCTNSTNRRNGEIGTIVLRYVTNAQENIHSIFHGPDLCCFDCNELFDFGQSDLFPASM